MDSTEAKESDSDNEINDHDNIQSHDNDEDDESTIALAKARILQVTSGRYRSLAHRQRRYPDQTFKALGPGP